VHAKIHWRFPSGRIVSDCHGGCDATSGRVALPQNIRRVKQTSCLRVASGVCILSSGQEAEAVKFSGVMGAGSAPAHAKSAADFGHAEPGIVLGKGKSEGAGGDFRSIAQSQNGSRNGQSRRCGSRAARGKCNFGAQGRNLEKPPSRRGTFPPLRGVVLTCRVVR
jgi:hypothetical protein